MEMPDHIMAQRSHLDQIWSSVADCIKNDPQRVTKMLMALQAGNAEAVRSLSDEDLKLMTTLALIALEEGVQQAAATVKPEQ